MDDFDPIPKCDDEADAVEFEGNVLLLLLVVVLALVLGMAARSEAGDEAAV